MNGTDQLLSATVCVNASGIYIYTVFKKEHANI